MANLQQLLRIGLALAFNPARLVEDAADAARRTMVMLTCMVVAGCVLLPAVGCGAAGLWIFVQHRLGPVWAAFITAAALVILAVLILLIGLLASRRPRRDRESRRSSPSAAGSAAAAAAAALPAAALAALSAPREAAAASARAGKGFFARHKGTALLAAAIVGLVVGQDLVRPRRERKPPRR